MHKISLFIYWANVGFKVDNRLVLRHRNRFNVTRLGHLGFLMQLGSTPQLGYLPQ